MSEPIADEALRYRFSQDPGQFRPLSSQLSAAQDSDQPQPSPGEEEPQQPQPGDGGPASPDPQPPKQQPHNVSWLDYFLAGRSKDELQKLKYNLERTSLGMAAFGVVIGEVLFLIDPSKLTVAVVLGGTAIMTIGLQYLASLVDEHLNTH